MTGLNTIASTIVASGKGVLAADESTGTCTKRFENVGVESNEENRRLYRQMLFTASQLGDYVGGIILFDETFRQSTDDGISFPDLLKSKQIIPGIKVDQGLDDLSNFPGEKHTTGLDGLRDRLAEYAELGAGFAKWRAVITINEGIPSMTCIRTNAKELAQYAALSQEAGIVPIVEPEVLINGDHTIEKCEGVNKMTLEIVFEELNNHKVRLDGIVLKPSMVIAGQDCPDQASTEDIADRTVAVLRECVPSDVPGIAFLSGGQTQLQATENLNTMNARHKDLPWRLTFSYGRALQESALNAFAAGDLDKGQNKLLHRAAMNGAASGGNYSVEMEK